MAPPTILTILLVVSTFGASANGAHILFYFAVSTYSHRIYVWPLVETLASRGHSVSFLSPFPNKEPPTPNVTDLVPSALTKLVSTPLEVDSDIIRDRFGGNRNAVWNSLPSIGLQSCQVLLQSPEWRQWVESSHFDLVVVDALYGECGLGLAHKFNARVIYFKTTTIYPWEFDMMGLPAETASIPDVQSDFQQDMDLATRVVNTVVPLVNHAYHCWVYQLRLEEILRKELGMPGMPSIPQLQGRISLVLLNAHYSTDYARALPPLFVPVAGIVKQRTHVKPLSHEMTSFVDSAEDGFIYVSFGTAVQVSKMDPVVLEIFVRAFGNSSMKFIWKFEGVSSVPPNVLTSKWIPQQTLLAHPRCKGFITHGGLGSIHEAIHYGIPLIVIPFFMDQDYNAERVLKLGFGITLEITTLSQTELETAITELIANPSYKRMMQEISISFKDRQNSPLETAVWWTEKVLRSSKFELSLLSPPGRNQPWYVRRLLDVWLLLLLLVVLPMTVVLWILWKITSRRTYEYRKQTKEKIKSS